MDAWIKFLFGTPRRVIGTLVVVLILMAIISPSIIQVAIDNLTEVFQQLSGLIISVIIVVALIKWAFKKIK